LSLAPIDLAVKRRLLIIVGLAAAGALLGYLALGPGLFYWKESVHHYKSGAESDLLALHTIEENYKRDHGGYAGTFSQLGVPMGAQLDGNALSWDGGPYRFRFTGTAGDGKRNLLGYSIEARPVSGSSRRYPVLRIDQSGSIHR
jgi:hypothetical protein